MFTNKGEIMLQFSQTVQKKMHIYIYIYIHACVYIYTYKCIYNIYTNTYILYTHTHTSIYGEKDAANVVKC